MNILLTGASGYIGRRLKHRLLHEKDISLRLLVKSPQSVKSFQNVHIAQGNTFDTDSLDKALKDIDTAYYLIHSMTSANFRELDKLSAKNFLDACIKNKVKRIIYLGGLGDKESASEHLLSRIETGEVLSSRPDDIQTIWFRAGVIIGSGSASFEIIRNLVEKLPVMIVPKWVETLCQPSSEKDVIEYLAQASFIPENKNLIVDIGSDAMRYKDLLLGYAHSVGLHRTLIPMPLFSPRLSSYWLTLMTPVPYSVASALVDGLKSEVIVKNSNASLYFPNIRPISYSDAVQDAINEIKNRQVISRWSDASGEAWEIDHSSLADAVYTDRQIFDMGDIPSSDVFKTVCSIGGMNGWFGYDLLWSFRGWIDKLAGGYGLSRGRRDAKELRIGDSIDFWKVVDLQENKRLLLYAQMKLPGKAWLEFFINDGKLYQSAYFYPHGLSGRLYWYLMFPFHLVIFSGMGRNILSVARNTQST